MCYEPLRFSPIFRRFVNSRESRVGLPLTPLNLTTKSVCALAQSSLFCGVCLIALRSLAHSHKQHPPLCVFYTLSTKQNTPLISSTTSRLEVPSRDFHKTQLPDSIGLSVTRVLTPIGYIALQFDSGGGAQSRAFVFVSCLRLSLALGLVVCLGGDNASSVVRRNNERARASPPRSSRLSPCRRVLSRMSSERGRARSRRSPPRFVWLSLIQLRGPD